jgi:hypothetical protein
MQKQLNEIKRTLETNGCTVTASLDDGMYAVVVNLGNGWAGDYDGGYWGDCSIENDKLELCFTFGDIYEEEEIACSEGFVHLKYKGGTEANGLAYTGDLDDAVCAKIRAVTNGVVDAHSSEQGMQGHYDDTESYLSLDVSV